MYVCGSAAEKDGDDGDNPTSAYVLCRLSGGKDCMYEVLSDPSRVFGVNPESSWMAIAGGSGVKARGVAVSVALCDVVVTGDDIAVARSRFTIGVAPSVALSDVGIIGDEEVVAHGGITSCCDSETGR